jgi:hypothetical protein
MKAPAKEIAINCIIFLDMTRPLVWSVRMLGNDCAFGVPCSRHIPGKTTLRSETESIVKPT